MDQMSLDAVRAIIDLLASAGGGEIEVTEGSLRVRVAIPRGVSEPALAAQTAPALAVPRPVAVPEAAASADLVVEAGMHGVFHQAPAPDAQPFVRPGEVVKAGQQICIIEAMKVFNAVRAPEDGVLSVVHVANGQDVAAGQPLFTFAPAVAAHDRAA